MVYIYDFILFFYHLGIRLYSPFNEKAHKWVHGRKNDLAKIGFSLQPNDKIAWFHCASLGEFEQGRPVIEGLKKKDPALNIMITFFSPSGYEVRKNYEYAKYVFYLPKDTFYNAKRFLNLVNPVMAVFIKYEFWFHYLDELKKKEIPTYLISAVFSQNQVFFKWYAGFFRKILTNYTQIFVQDKQSTDLLNTIGIQNHTLSGDTRFDRVYDTVVKAAPIVELNDFKQGRKVLVAGSTWKQDEEALVELINNKAGRELKFIIAPHETSQENVTRLCSAIGHEAVKYSALENTNIRDVRVLIIDNVGLLARLYQYGDIAYIGGGFKYALHNILEPAAYGMPIVFGPGFGKFREAVELIEKGGAFTIASGVDLADKVNFLLSDPYIIRIASEICRNYVRQNRGAADIVLKKLVTVPLSLPIKEICTYSER